MELIPRPCFGTLQEFAFLKPETLDGELPIVMDFLNRCPVSSLPIKSYILVKQFLTRHAEPTRYANYRVYVERLLLWCILEAKKPLTDLSEADVQGFMGFCAAPPDSWVANSSGRRFTPAKLRSAVRFNPNWRPFCHNKASGDEVSMAYVAGRGGLGMQMSVVASFFQELYCDDLITINPAQRLHAAGFYAQSLPAHTGANIFNDEEFAALMLTLQDMADENIKYERTLLMLATVYYLRLQSSEIDSLGGDLTISALGLMRDGTYDLVEDKFPGRWAWKIHPEFVTTYVNRYRQRLGRQFIPYERDQTLLLGKVRGNGSICSGQARLIFRAVCRTVIERLTSSGYVVSPNSALRTASLLWLRETSLHHAARTMGMDEVIRLVRKSNAETAFQRYFAWRD
ncbi:hypothetical protein ACTXN4_27020 [Pseudomonas helleri]|uniref:hypothetical protein n=1 Tax=Pseudomonas TaxID=286 RepID=UPI0012B93DB6|nr:hypothetical protein [Pseudomonas sp.]